MWTADLQFAERFADFEAAEDLVSTRRFENVEVVFISKDGQVQGGVRMTPEPKSGRQAEGFTPYLKH
jgi:hypothetical protein